MGAAPPDPPHPCAPTLEKSPVSSWSSLASRFSISSSWADLEGSSHTPCGGTNQSHSQMSAGALAEPGHGPVLPVTGRVSPPPSPSPTSSIGVSWSQLVLLYQPAPTPRTCGPRPHCRDPKRGLWDSAHCQNLLRTSFSSFFTTGVVTRFSIPWGTVASFCQGSSWGDLGESQRRS